MSKEQIFTHNQVKAKFGIVLAQLAKANRYGLYFPDGVYLSNEIANLSCRPDGCYVSRRSLRLDRVRLEEGAEEGYVELMGTPDMALEVMSPSSVRKDTVRLRELYWRAGINEYWLVDARGLPIRFAILRRTAKGYVQVPRQAGWQKSTVFGKAFKLTARDDEDGFPEYTLAIR